jgi:hypothetical protein
MALYCKAVMMMIMIVSLEAKDLNLCIYIVLFKGKLCRIPHSSLEYLDAGKYLPLAARATNNLKGLNQIGTCALPNGNMPLPNGPTN